MKNKSFKHYQKLVCFTGLAGNTIYLFQAYQIWQTKSSHDVTKIGFIVSFLSTTNWAIQLSYGRIKKSNYDHL